jgi:hypothetical protein
MLPEALLCLIHPVPFFNVEITVSYYDLRRGSTLPTTLATDELLTVGMMFARLALKHLTPGELRSTAQNIGFGGKVPADMVKELSLERAGAVKDEVIKQFKFDDNRFAVDGLGWDRPADMERPDEHSLNRRVEIKVYSAEKE